MSGVYTVQAKGAGTLSMSDLQGPGRHVGLNHVEGGRSSGKHRYTETIAELEKSEAPASRTTEFAKGHGHALWERMHNPESFLD